MKTLRLLALGATAVLAVGCSTGTAQTSTTKVRSTLPDASVPDVFVPNANVSITVDTTVQYQTLVGFGAATAWYGEKLAAFPDGAAIYDVAFRDLGLDILRFRNKFGRQDVGNSSDITAEAALLQHAKQSLGRAPKVLLSSWSPPARLKASGFENCATSVANNNTTCTLAKDASGNFVYADFAKYWSDSLNYYANAGIVPDYISIENEPDFVPNGWEGCKFTTTEISGFPGYDKALAAVHDAIATSSTVPQMIGPETLGIKGARPVSDLTDANLSLLSAVAHHLYQGNAWLTPDSYSAEMTAVGAAAEGLPIFQTEFDTPGNVSVGGFETAWVMHNSLAVEGVSAFLYWDLIWSSAAGCLIVLNNGQYTLRDQYFAVRHFARYTDPGYVRIDAESSNSQSIRASAYLSPDSSQLTIVVLNVDSFDAQLTLNAPVGFAVSSSEIYRTIFRTGDAGTSETWTSLGGLESNQPLTLPSRSVATVVLHAEALDAQ